MLSANDLFNIFLPVFSHWIIWLIFFAIVIIDLLLYAYPYFKKPRKEFRRYHASILIANVISLYIFTKMLEGVIYQGSILKVDAWFNEIIYSSWITNVALFITLFGNTVIIIILFMFALTVLLLRKKLRYALLSTVAILGALALEVAIKNLVHRARPENLIQTGFSFPSGHAMMAIIFVSLLIYSFKDNFKDKRVRYVLITAASAFFISVGISRIILHVHWFSDVMAGISLSLFWFMFVALIERPIIRPILDKFNNLSFFI